MHIQIELHYEQQLRIGYILYKGYNVAWQKSLHIWNIPRFKGPIPSLKN